MLLPAAPCLMRGARARRPHIPIFFVDIVARPDGGLRAVLQTELSQDGLHMHLHRDSVITILRAMTLFEAPCISMRKIERFPARQRRYGLP